MDLGDVGLEFGYVETDLRGYGAVGHHDVDGGFKGDGGAEGELESDVEVRAAGGEGNGCEGGLVTVSMGLAINGCTGATMWEEAYKPSVSDSVMSVRSSITSEYGGTARLKP